MSSDSSGRSDDNDDDDEETSAKDNTCYGDGNGDGGVDSNTGIGGGSAEYMGFLSPNALWETFGAMEKAKASVSSKLIKT